MTNTTIANFSVDYLQILAEDGTLTAEPPACVADPQLMIAMYKMLVLTRTFDTKAIALQRTGKLGTYPSSLGQEAIGVGIGAMMRDDDVLCPYYREYAAQFWRGVTMEEIYAYWGGDERGSDFQHPVARQDMPICIPIGSQTLHAVGIATAIKYRQQQRAVVVVVGDGGTSRGDFYEAINVAGCWNLPVVFVINNNQWAISVPRSEQTHAGTFAQKAFAAGLPGRQVDGNDVFAVSLAVKEALTTAYAGKGATVIEAISYRMCDHTTADDARRYRDSAELERYQQKDPITRMRSYLQQQHGWDANKEQALIAECTTQVNAAVDAYLARRTPPLASMFDYLYATLPEAYSWQREEVISNEQK